VTKGKTVSAPQVVPVHPVITPLVASLVRSSDDGYLIPGLLVSGRDQKRSVLLSKRLAWHLREQLKITDPQVVAAHSLRHTFTNALERAGVPETTAKLLVGHRRQSITYGDPGGSYSSSLPLEKLADAVSRVDHGGPVAALIGRLVRATSGSPSGPCGAPGEAPRQSERRTMDRGHRSCARNADMRPRLPRTAACQR
jgi:hypothetical protein